MTAGPTPNNERRWECVYRDPTCGANLPCGHGCGYDERQVAMVTDLPPSPESQAAIEEVIRMAHERLAAAPVPSPVPSRPDTAALRRLEPTNPVMSARKLMLQAADWIDAQPAADQGPDLSELRVLADSWKQRGITASTVFGSFSAASVYDECASDLRRLLDREGGS